MFGTLTSHLGDQRERPSTGLFAPLHSSIPHPPAQVNASSGLGSPLPNQFCTDVIQGQMRFLLSAAIVQPSGGKSSSVQRPGGTPGVFHLIPKSQPQLLSSSSSLMLNTPVSPWALSASTRAERFVHVPMLPGSTPVLSSGSAVKATLALSTVQDVREEATPFWKVPQVG